MKYTDPDGRSPKPGIYYFLNPFQSNYDKDPLKQFGNAGWQTLGIIALLLPHVTGDEAVMAEAGAGAIAKVAEGTKEAVAIVGVVLSVIKTLRDPKFRQNLAGRTGENPPDADAHHNLPVKLGEFFKKAGIDFQNSKFGSWVDRVQHQGMSKEFQADWESFAEINPNASKSKILDFARALADKYGVTSDF